MESEKPRSSVDVVHHVPQLETIAEAREVKPVEKVGRTGWDLLAELRAPKFHDQPRPPTNWYRLFFFLLLLVAIVYSGLHLRTGFDAIDRSVSDMAKNVDELRKSSAASTSAAERIEKQFQTTPAVAAKYAPQALDIPACKAKAMEVLQRSGVTQIDVSQTNAVTGKFFSPASGMSNVLLVCTPHKVVFLVISGREEREVVRIRDMLVGEMDKVAQADSTPNSAPRAGK